MKWDLCGLSMAMTEQNELTSCPSYFLSENAHTYPGCH
jgi:hypothetical protein